MNTQKGITLVALVILMVVLMTIAAVTIGNVTGDGVMNYAQNASTLQDLQMEEKKIKIAMIESQFLAEYELETALKQKLGSETVIAINDDGTVTIILESQNQYRATREGDVSLLKRITFAEAQSNEMFDKTENSITYDNFENKIVIPAGFKIRVDETTNNADDVTKGIVIEDKGGNQFVWIPVGKIYTNQEKTTYDTITLGRYSWNGTTATLQQPVEGVNTYKDEIAVPGYDNAYTYTEYQPTTNSYVTKAKNINAFYLSAKQNGGFYFGRYEAGDGDIETARDTNSSDENKVVCKADTYVYNFVTQTQASSLCQGMYSNSPFASDLVNGYAWDTCMIFIQKFGLESYVSKTGASSINRTQPQKTGMNKSGFYGTNDNIDRQCNIFDMAGNCTEWTTEECSFSYGKQTYRRWSVCKWKHKSCYKIS